MSPTTKMKVEQRAPTSMEEKKEFDSVTFDQIQTISDVSKLRRLEQYMRDEGFTSTADAARVRLHEMGSRTFTDDEEVAKREAEVELSKAREELSSWKAELGALRQKKGARRANQEVPTVRDGVAGKAGGASITEVVEERFDAGEVEFMAEREKEKGNELFKAGEYKESVEAYDKSISLAPKAATLANRAAAKLKLKLYDGAIEDCTLALAQDPKYVKVLMRRAVARMELKRYEEAYEDIEVALEGAPGNKELQKMRDKVLRKMPQRVTQVEIEEVSDSDSDFGEEAPREEDVGKIEEIVDAEEDVGQLVEIAEEAPRAEPAKEVGRTRIQIEVCSDSSDEETSGDEQEQEDDKEQEVGAVRGPSATSSPSPAPPSAEELKAKGNAAYSSGDLRAALHWYTESIGREQCSAVYSNRAQVHLVMKNFESAISDCDSALALDGSNIKATYRRARALKEAGRMVEALACLEIVKQKMPRRADIQGQIDELRRLKAEAEKEARVPSPEPKAAAKKSPAASPAVIKSPSQAKQDLPIPQSSTEFETNVRFMRKCPEDLARYVYQIPVEKFATLFKKTFTSEILGSTIEGLLAGFDHGSFSFCHEVLDSFTRADRFSITSKMLSSKHKACLRELFDRLSEAPTAGGADLASLKKGYGVK